MTCKIVWMQVGREGGGWGGAVGMSHFHSTANIHEATFFLEGNDHPCRFWESEKPITPEPNTSAMQTQPCSLRDYAPVITNKEADADI